MQHPHAIYSLKCLKEAALWNDSKVKNKQNGENVATRMLEWLSNRKNWQESDAFQNSNQITDKSVAQQRAA